jgi:outer membrane biogenesis lipoprotein LolB
MKKPLIILLNIAALLTGACASQTTTPAQLKLAAPVVAPRLSPSQEYQNYVMKHANAVHAEVHWYHIPDDDDVDKTDS